MEILQMDENSTIKFEIKFTASLVDKPPLCIRWMGDQIILSGVKGEFFLIDKHNKDNLVLNADQLKSYYKGSGE